VPSQYSSAVSSNHVYCIVIKESVLPSFGGVVLIMNIASKSYQMRCICNLPFTSYLASMIFAIFFTGFSGLSVSVNFFYSSKIECQEGFFQNM